MASEIDVCLLLEGTYPYVRGGVSAWVHQLVVGLPELRFSVVFIGGQRPEHAAPRYEVPPNVVHLEAHYLEDALRDQPPSAVDMPARMLGESCMLHDYFKARGARRSLPLRERQVFEQLVDRMLQSSECPTGPGLRHLLYSAGAWELIRRTHEESAADLSFVDYFWTVRQMHGPIFQLARIAAQVPEAGLYHSASTGYAGLLGAFLQRRRRRRLILTEHGIYTKERRIDLNHAAWLERPGARMGSSQALRGLWIRYFESLGRLAYRSADPIIALYEGNRLRQVDDGAAPERTRTIVNGIDIDGLAGALADRSDAIPPVVGLIGRVVPIKDIKTFIRVIERLSRPLRDVQGWIIGGSDEAPDYADECQALVRSLGLSAHVRFLGHREVRAVLPQLGLLMLTSISEAQPLVVLEAFAAGVPCIATDVGGCREQIEGRDAADRSLGAAGRVVPFADVGALAGAAHELLSDRSAWRACQAAGLARVRRSYGVRTMLDSYRTLYRNALEA
jgi:glycosyltransferase involved in cell wall biosynthesis